MRIADAVQRLRSAGNEIAPDQLLDMDFLTEYPIVDDSDLKRPMIYYCHAGQWLHISRAITKPYKRALEAIDILDDDLRACRLQITWFEDAYFNPAPVSLLEDQRRGRIPLLNFFRYYACWLFIAERSKVKQFSTLTVRDGFSILIESTTDQYVTLLGYVGKKLLNATAASDQTQIFSDIAMIQHLVSVPISAIEESQRHSIADIVEKNAQIESEIERRIVTEFPSAISALSKAIKDFPNWDTDEIPSTFEWSGLSRIETAYPEMVADYEKASRVFQSLEGLTRGKRDSEYLVSSDRNFEAAFNAVVARDVVAHISMAEANAIDESATGFLFPLNFTDWEMNAVLPALKELINAAPFRESLSNQIALVHLFLPFYIADLQTHHSGLVRLEFVKAARVLRSCLAALPDFNVEQLRSLIIRCETTWQDWNIPIGIAYGILDNAGKELLLGSTHDAVRLLTVHCGDRREKMLDYLGRCRLHQLYADSAKMLKAIARNEFAQEHYERFGFILTTKLIKPLTIETKLQREETEEHVVAETLVKHAVDVPEILKMEAYEAILLRNRQESELKFFAEHVPFILKWQHLWDEIVINNRNVANSLIADLLVPANPTSQDFVDRKKVIPDKKTLASVIRDLKLVISNKENNGHERHMIGRLVVLGLSIELRNIDHVAWLCGFRTKDKPFNESVLPSESNRSTLSRYLNTYGLVFQDLSSPLESSRINKREAVFLKARLASK